MTDEPTDITQLDEAQADQGRFVDRCRRCGDVIEVDAVACPRHPDAGFVKDWLPSVAPVQPAVAGCCGKPTHMTARHSAMAVRRRGSPGCLEAIPTARGRARPMIQLYLPMLGGCMPQDANQVQRAEWAAGYRRSGVLLTPDMDPTAPLLAPPRY
jgi:hypothetical protein